jgi:hypothetical protein
MECRAVPLHRDRGHLRTEWQPDDAAVLQLLEHVDQRHLRRRRHGARIGDIPERIGRRLCRGMLRGRPPERGDGELSKVLQVLGDDLLLAPPGGVGRAQDAGAPGVGRPRPEAEDGELLAGQDLNAVGVEDRAGE